MLVALATSLIRAAKLPMIIICPTLPATKAVPTPVRVVAVLNCALAGTETVPAPAVGVAFNAQAIIFCQLKRLIIYIFF
jgi:hypothetical protein